MEESETFHVKGKPLPAGTWTDDTSMALCLGQSLVENNGLQWKDAAAKWCDWYTSGKLMIP
jgi:ADP-ribosyl-[dinitrogen reductase] hydrolase